MWERLKGLVLHRLHRAVQDLEEDLQAQGIQIEALESEISTLQWLLGWMNELETE